MYFTVFTHTYTWYKLQLNCIKASSFLASLETVKDFSLPSPPHSFKTNYFNYLGIKDYWTPVEFPSS